MPDDEATKVVQPADGSFDNPASAIPTQLSAVLGRRSDATFAVGADQIDVTVGKPVAERIAIGGTIVDQLAAC